MRGLRKSLSQEVKKEEDLELRQVTEADEEFWEKLKREGYEKKEGTVPIRLTRWCLKLGVTKSKGIPIPI